jgi:hypothetical protein
MATTKYTLLSNGKYVKRADQLTKSTRVAAAGSKPVFNMLRRRKAVLQKEFVPLDVVMEKDIEALSDKDFRRWRRLKKVLKEKDISGLDE